MAAVTCGATLVKKLKESGTPEWRLESARKLLADTHEAEGKVAAAEDVIKALEGSLPGGAENGTVRKARQIAETGEAAAPRPAGRVPVEESILAAVAERQAKAAKKSDKPAA